MPEAAFRCADSAAPIERLDVGAYRVPTDRPESDGTLEWDSTTIVIVEAASAGRVGLGFTYCDRAAAVIIAEQLAPMLVGRDAFAIKAAWHAMSVKLRNLGRPGIAAAAIAACDVALHDLAAKLLDVPVLHLLGGRHRRLPVYGSGGFTSYSEDELEEQLGDWARNGFKAVKMKVGRQAEHDGARVRRARKAIGADVELFVDANGAYGRKQALALAEEFAACGVSWFEEPVSSDDRDGLRLIRDRAPAGMAIAAGEYGYTPSDFLALLQAGAVDCLQADATRCAGFTGYLIADSLAHAFKLPLSSHTAPALHLQCCCASLQTRHIEWFHDHVRIEAMFFDGVPEVTDGMLQPALDRPGLGLSFKRRDAEIYRV